MRLPGVPFYPADPSNYTAGRSGRSIKYFTVHHSAGFESTLRYLWANPARNGSSHFFAGNGFREQYVDTNDTAWTNGNWNSNCESITCETRGDWRNGYYDQSTLDQLTEIMYQCLKAYPHLQLTYHQDVSDIYTLCPADLKHNGYAANCWNNAKARIARENAPAPTPTPTPSNISYAKITPKRIELIRDANLWNFDFTSWNSAQSVKTYPQGYLVDVVAVATNALGGKYYMTAYSYNDGNIRATNGFNTADVKDYVAPAPTPQPTPTPVWLPMDNPRSLVTTQDVKVVDLDSMKEIGDTIPKGTDVQFTTKKTMSDNKVYLRSKWATDNNKNWGIPMDSLTEVPVPTPDVPTEPPVEPPVETIPPTPIDTNPETPGAGDVEERLSALEKIVKYITDFLKGLFSGFKSN